MSAQPEALRLAEILEGGSRQFNDEAAAELRRLHEENERLRAQHASALLDTKCARAQRDALLETLRHAAAIAHSGGLQGMTEWQSLVAVRRLTLPYFERSGSITETHDRLRAAIAKAEGEQT